jgi:hypothetical protein
VLLSLARELKAHGQVDASREIVERALTWLDTQADTGDSTSEAHVLRARLLYCAERWADAARALETPAGDSSRALERLGFSGTLAARRGALDSARAFAAGIAALPTPGPRGAAALWRARVAAALGERELAVSLLRQAFREGADFGIWLHADQDFESLRDYQPFLTMLNPNR